MTTAKPVALVTGASSGIGKAASLALVEAGFEVVGTSRKASGVAQRDGVTFLDLDVTSDESVDHEVREHGVRVLLVEPAYTRTGFDAKAIQPDAPLPIYAEQRQVFDGVIARAMAGGDDPATVAKSIVAAATDPKPKLRYTAGSTARGVSALRRFVPAWAFDRQIRKLNRLPAGGSDPHSTKQEEKRVNQAKARAGQVTSRAQSKFEPRTRPR